MKSTNILTMRLITIAILMVWTTSSTAFQAPIANTIQSSKSLVCTPKSFQNKHIQFQGLPTCKTRKSSYKFMSVEGDFNPESISRDVALSQTGSLKSKIRSIYKFSRPHTIRGTILASIAGTLRALIDTNFSVFSTSWTHKLPRAFIGMFSLLLGNVFIVGINQIYDKSIDELNKPFLPVASGEMSNRFAWISVIAAGIGGPLLVYNFFPPLLFKLYMMGLVLGGIYSVPPIRTKRSAVLAGLTIAVVRGFLLNFGVYYAVKDAIGSSFSWSPKVTFIARFMTLFATVIAVTKDLPDTEGDKAYNIETFATKIGVERIAKYATLCLFLNYLGAIATGLRAAPGIYNSIPMIGGHSALALVLIKRFRDLSSDSFSFKAIKLFYKNVWDLFYLEYVLYTLI